MSTIWRKNGLVARASALTLCATGAAWSFADDKLIQGGVLEEIVVTARKTSENVQDVPISISTFSQQKMTDMHMVNLADVSRQTPNFTIDASVADVNTTNLSMRGQVQTDIILTVDPPVGVYVDGVYLPRSQGLMGALVDMERVEVLRGPQGTLYGKNTTGGAVNVITRKPDLSEFDGYIQSSYASYDEFKVRGAVNIPVVPDKLAVRMVGDYTNQGEGWGEDGNGEDINDTEQRYFRSNILWQITEKATLLLSGDYNKIESTPFPLQLTYVPSLLDPGTNRNFGAALASLGLQSGMLTPEQVGAFFAGDPSVIPAVLDVEDFFRTFKRENLDHFHDSFITTPTKADFDAKGVSANFSYEFDDLTFVSISGYREFNRDGVFDDDGTPYTLLQVRQPQKDQTYSQEFQLVDDDGQGLDWLLGAFYSFEQGDDESISESLLFINPNNPNHTRGKVENESSAIFGQLIYSLSDQLRVTGGLRYTYETKELVSKNMTGTLCSVPEDLRVPTGECESQKFSDNFDNVSYLLSFDYQAADDVLLYAKTARGFKSGGQNLRGNQTAGSFAPFDSETVTEYEIGTKLDALNGRLRFNAAIFYDEYDDAQRAITLATAEGTTYTLTTNAASATIWGVETDITYIPIDQITLNATVGYVHPEYDEFEDATGDRSDEPFFVPDWTYSVSALYKTQMGDGELRAATYWEGRSKTNFLPANVPQFSDQGAYGLLGARIAYTYQPYDADISVFGSNLLDKEYNTSGLPLDQALGWNLAVPGSPRIIGVELVKRF